MFIFHRRHEMIEAEQCPPLLPQGILSASDIPTKKVNQLSTGSNLQFDFAWETPSSTSAEHFSTDYGIRQYSRNAVKVALNKTDVE